MGLAQIHEAMVKPNGFKLIFDGRPHVDSAVVLPYDRQLLRVMKIYKSIAVPTATEWVEIGLIMKKKAFVV